MYWLVTITCIFAVAETSHSPSVGFVIGDTLGITKCDIGSAKISTDNTSCGLRPTSCSDSYYRTHDGSCNNLKYGWWATPYTPFKRLFDNNYSDGVHDFPKTTKKKNLPNPREISLKLFSTLNKDDSLWTVAFMQYGQIIAHDMSLTAGVGQTEKVVECCTTTGKPTKLAETDHRCAPIPIPLNDLYNIPLGRTCFNFYRTEATQDRHDCEKTTVVSEPLTSVTGVLDASYLYGSDAKTAYELREKKGGRLKSVKRNGSEFLPQDPQPTVVCNVQQATDICYKSGDVRVNQNPQLALIHNIYMLHHNNVADELAKFNPHWDDETIYQETRRIVIAVHQRIFYYEMLLFILGVSNLVYHKVVYPGAKLHINDYDPSISPAVSNEFATAAFRFLHTEIQGDLKNYNDSQVFSNIIKLRDYMNQPGIIESGNNFLGLTRGLVKQPQSAIDAYFTIDILDYLFQNGKRGQDLKAIDIMRARDHGLATYAQVLEKCCLGKPKNFRDFAKYIKPQDVLKLEALYDSHEDVDLVVGMSMETKLPSSLCGPTSCCLIGEQFYRSRRGDRYFFENNQHKSAFTIEQLNIIRKVTFASLICQVPGITHIQPRAFEQVSIINPLLPCQAIPKLDLKPWKALNIKKKAI